MKRNKPKKFSNKNNTKLNLFINVQIFAVICYVGIFLIGSLIALLIDLPSDSDYLFSIVLFSVCSMLTGFYAGIKKRENGLLVGIIYTLPLNAIVVLISLFYNSFAIGVNLAVTIVVLMISGAIGGILAVNKRLRR
jgi:putative membrane protein (TIGR04086 family)